MNKKHYYGIVIFLLMVQCTSLWASEYKEAAFLSDKLSIPNGYQVVEQGTYEDFTGDGMRDHTVAMNKVGEENYLIKVYDGQTGAEFATSPSIKEKIVRLSAGVVEKDKHVIYTVATQSIVREEYDEVTKQVKLLPADVKETRAFKVEKGKMTDSSAIIPKADYKMVADGVFSMNLGVPEKVIYGINALRKPVIIRDKVTPGIQFDGQNVHEMVLNTTLLAGLYDVNGSGRCALNITVILDGQHRGWFLIELEKDENGKWDFSRDNEGKVFVGGSANNVIFCADLYPYKISKEEFVKDGKITLHSQNMIDLFRITRTQAMQQLKEVRKYIEKDIPITQYSNDQIALDFREELAFPVRITLKKDFNVFGLTEKTSALEIDQYTTKYLIREKKHTIVDMPYYVANYKYKKMPPVDLLYQVDNADYRQQGYAIYDIAFVMNGDYTVNDVIIGASLSASEELYELEVDN